MTGVEGRGLPVVLVGPALRALVVGGGAVAERKVRALRAGGARVRIVAPRVTDGLRAAAAADAAIELVERAYVPGDVADALLVVAATDDRAVNAAVAREAHAAGRLVNVADRPEEGNVVTPAVHRAGDVLVAVTAAGVPGAAARIRDAIAARFDARYARGVALLAGLRGRLLAAGRSADWREAAAALAGADFCEAVESGRLEEAARRWA